ncbi:uncharacterized protein LOC134074829 [Sardina pilchardus]|uniref:uncharacterized protein LOC134074829 n=1 Tax=Sardina pilchardus TaxID=27697 RepID=UPI002E0D2E7A
MQPFGCPEVLHSDQGANFESTLIHELCQLYGCRKTRTTPYHPQGNGSCERFNQTLLNLLGTLESEQQNRWVEHLPSLLHAYNNSVHATTGYAPSYLMFGRHTRLPVDLLLGTTPSEGVGSISEWVSQHHERLRYAYSKASENLGAAAQKNRRLYDRTAREAPLLPGERVLVWDNRRRGKGKLSDRWESQPYVVVSQRQDDLPVYVVRPEGKPGPERVLHRNLLRPCPHYPQTTAEGTEKQGNPSLPLMGWTWAPVDLNQPGQGLSGSDPVPGPRRSQRETQGRPPDRCAAGSWGLVIGTQGVDWCSLGRRLQSRLCVARGKSWQTAGVCNKAAGPT